MTYQPLAQQWRPQNFQQMIGQDAVLKGLIYALTHQKLHHAYLFTGTRGVGKTSVARILAKSLNCETGITPTPCGTCLACQEITQGCFVDLIEIDAASRTKVEDMREILDNVQYPPTVGRFKIYLIDEAHMLSGHSFNALLKTLEEPPHYVKFLLATTDPQKMPVTILSRCLQYSLRNIPAQMIETHLQFVLNSEKIAYEASAITLLSRAAAGSLRDALSLLDQAISSGSGKVSHEQTQLMLGFVDHQDVLNIATALSLQQGEKLMELAMTLFEKGADFDSALEALGRLFHQLSVAKLFKESSPGEFEPEKIQALLSKFTHEQLQVAYQITILCRKDLALAPDPKIGFEMTLLRLLAFYPEIETNAPTQKQNIPKAPAPSAPKIQPALMPRETGPTLTQTPQQMPEKSVTPPSCEPHDLSETWRKIAEPLTGISKHLAQHCLLVCQGAEVQLMIDPNSNALFTDKIKQSYRQALLQHYGDAAQISFHLGTLTGSAKTEAQLQEEGRQALEAKAQRDPGVLAIQTHFDASIAKVSVTLPAKNSAAQT